MKTSYSDEITLAIEYYNGHCIANVIWRFLGTLVKTLATLPTLVFADVAQRSTTLVKNVGNLPVIKEIRWQRWQLHIYMHCQLPTLLVITYSILFFFISFYKI